MLTDPRRTSSICLLNIRNTSGVVCELFHLLTINLLFPYVVIETLCNSKITQKQLHGFPQTLGDGWSIGQGRTPGQGVDSYVRWEYRAWKSFPAYPQHISPPVPSSSAGLKEHDVIISINGQRISTATDVSAAIKKEGTLRVVVRRGNEDAILTVVPMEIDPWPSKNTFRKKNPTTGAGAKFHLSPVDLIMEMGFTDTPSPCG